MLFPRPRTESSPHGDEIVVHPTSIVEPGARLGLGVEVGPGAIIGEQVTLHDRVHVGAGVVIMGQVEIGEDTRVWPKAILGGEPQDTNFDGSPSAIRIGPRCEVRELVTIHRGTGAGTETVIGADVMLMATCHVAHNCFVQDGAVLANGVLLAGHVHVGEKAFISGNAVAHQFVRIGRLAMIGGLARVNRDCPPFGLIRDFRLRGLNTVGLRRAGVDELARAELRELYRILRGEVGPLSETTVKLREAATTPEGLELVEFLEAESSRGFCGF